MNLIVFSFPFNTGNETKIITELFENGLATFHLRKPDYKYKEFKNLLDKIPSVYHEKIVIHSHYELCDQYKLKGIHLTGMIRQNLNKERLSDTLNKYKIISASFHEPDELAANKDVFCYVFLSPVFDSISKINYFSAFNFKDVSILLSKVPYDVIALGGINLFNINQAKKMGFHGIAALGAIWKSDDPLKAFREISDCCAGMKNNDRDC